MIEYLLLSQFMRDNRPHKARHFIECEWSDAESRVRLVDQLGLDTQAGGDHYRAECVQRPDLIHEPGIGAPIFVQSVEDEKGRGPLFRRAVPEEFEKF